MIQLIKKYQDRIDNILEFQKVKNINDIISIRSRTIARLLKSVIEDLKQIIK